MPALHPCLRCAQQHSAATRECLVLGQAGMMAPPSHHPVTRWDPSLPLPCCHVQVVASEWPGSHRKAAHAVLIAADFTEKQADALLKPRGRALEKSASAYCCDVLSDVWRILLDLLATSPLQPAIRAMLHQLLLPVLPSAPRLHGSCAFVCNDWLAPRVMSVAGGCSAAASSPCGAGRAGQGRGWAGERRGVEVSEAVGLWIYRRAVAWRPACYIGWKCRAAWGHSSAPNGKGR